MNIYSFTGLMRARVPKYVIRMILAMADPKEAALKGDNFMIRVAHQYGCKFPYKRASIAAIWANWDFIEKNAKFSKFVVSNMKNLMGEGRYEELSKFVINHRSWADLFTFAPAEMIKACESDVFKISNMNMYSALRYRNISVLYYLCEKKMNHIFREITSADDMYLLLNIGFDIRQHRRYLLSMYPNDSAIVKYLLSIKTTITEHHAKRFLCCDAPLKMTF